MLSPKVSQEKRSLHRYDGVCYALRPESYQVSFLRRLSLPNIFATFLWTINM